MKKLFMDYIKAKEDQQYSTQIKAEFIQLVGNGRRPIIVYGAGIVTGPSLLSLLKSVNITPVAIVDSDSIKWGKKIDGITIMSIQEAYEQYGTEVTIAIAVKGNYTDKLMINEKLDMLGYHHIIQCEQWLSYRAFLGLKDYNLMTSSNDLFICEEEHKIRKLLDYLADDASKLHLQEIIAARLLPYEHKYTYHQTSYFLDEYYDEIVYTHVVDCGAYRGDTLNEFYSSSKRKEINKTYHAFEIDPNNLRYLQAEIEGHDKEITIHPVAVSDYCGEIKIVADGSIGSYVHEEGNMTILAKTLDEALKETPISFIKMDIEGAEQEALRGARKVIEKNRPVLVISTYHANRDLWEIPHMIHEMVEDYVGLIRMQGLFEYIYVAIPRERYLFKER